VISLNEISGFLIYFLSVRNHRLPDDFPLRVFLYSAVFPHIYAGESMYAREKHGRWGEIRENMNTVREKIDAEKNNNVGKKYSRWRKNTGAVKKIRGKIRALEEKYERCLKNTGAGGGGGIRGVGDMVAGGKDVCRGIRWTLEKWTPG
jgi:hypothetical protein